ncbi:hypothetical protein BsWGS_12577 [Bradybaena similaris]
MSAFVCLLVCALLGVACSGSIVKRESSPEPQYSPCYYKETWYSHGDSLPHPCNLCTCQNGSESRRPSPIPERATKTGPGTPMETVYQANVRCVAVIMAT